MVNNSKAPEKTDAEKYPRKAIPVDAGKTIIETYRNHAEVTTSPEVAAFRVINGAAQQSGDWLHIDVPTLLDALRDQAKTVNGGDMKQPEAMLMNQATALQSLFARLTEKAMGTEYMSNFEAFMRMALRAQSQCRATLETLATIKNPPIIYAKQANISQGHQQVNNNCPPIASHAEEIKNEQNQQSGDASELRKNTGTPSLEKQADSPLETLGEVHRPENTRR